MSPDQRRISPDRRRIARGRSAASLDALDPAALSARATFAARHQHDNYITKNIAFSLLPRDLGTPFVTLTITNGNLYENHSHLY
ncbi:hypothetical protein QMA69_21365 [Burkholderia pseudomallei]|nr:hypothetical protein [Burkholderia pseudomallei]